MITSLYVVRVYDIVGKKHEEGADICNSSLLIRSRWGAIITGLIMKDWNSSSRLAGQNTSKTLRFYPYSSLVDSQW